MKELPVLRTIDSIIARINTHPEYSACARDRAEAALREQAINHSLRLESRSELDGQGQEHEGTKTTSAEKKQMMQAWNHLGQYGITLPSLASLGSIITTGTNGNFRKRDVQFGGFAPPAPERLVYEVNSLVDRLNHSNVHPVIRAIDAHVDLVRIHPYEDGNGRSARLLQNYCLNQHGYPAATIPHTEQAVYIGLMQATLKDRLQFASSAEQPSENEGLLIKYLSGKVLQSAEDLDAELQTKREFELIIPGIRDKGVVFAVTHAIKNYSRAHGNGTVRTHIMPNTTKRSARLSIQGNISEEDIVKAISTMRHEGVNGYTISPNKC